MPDRPSTALPQSDAVTREYNLDGLVGPAHNYGGLSPGNLACTKNVFASGRSLRVALTPEEVGALSGRVLYSEALARRLETWVAAHYRDRLTAGELGDPTLWREVMTALDELS